MGVDGLHQSRVKSIAGVGLVLVQHVVHHLRGQSHAGGFGQARGLGAVADDASDTRIKTCLPLVALGGLGDGQHIGAAARDKNHDVFHS